jgi:hypothetical protein
VIVFASPPKEERNVVPKPSIILFSNQPRRFQPRTELGGNLPTLPDATEAAAFLQMIYRRLGYELDFTEGLTEQRKQVLETLAQKVIANSGLK